MRTCSSYIVALRRIMEQLIRGELGSKEAVEKGKTVTEQKGAANAGTIGDASGEIDSSLRSRIAAHAVTSVYPNEDAVVEGIEERERRNVEITAKEEADGEGKETKGSIEVTVETSESAPEEMGFYESPDPAGEEWLEQKLLLWLELNLQKPSLIADLAALVQLPAKEMTLQQLHVSPMLKECSWWSYLCPELYVGNVNVPVLISCTFASGAASHSACCRKAPEQGRPCS
jgi:hypothetical protein